MMFFKKHIDFIAHLMVYSDHYLLLKCMYHLYTDPYGSWLRVDLRELSELGIADRISSESKIFEGYVFLISPDLEIFLDAKCVTKEGIDEFLSRSNPDMVYREFKTYCPVHTYDVYSPTYMETKPIYDQKLEEILEKTPHWGKKQKTAARKAPRKNIDYWWGKYCKKSL